MTKKELLENEWFKAAPDNTPIVFNTSEYLAECEPLRKGNIWYMSKATNAQGIPPSSKLRKEPLVIKAIVIDAIPCNFLENVCNIHIKL